MIKVTNLNKYFNKNKANEIHVINNTTLSFPKSGLVAITGSSGSGKTTLLNVLSGLDDAKGEISFKNINMASYKSNQWDKLRAHNIGFIFQNYYLLEDRSIYENIKLTLNMIGIVDKEEVEYRISYCLNAVGLFRFRKRQASDLSFGQKQRVAIARAIAKNPDVIIADEPTGNLDLKNSVEIMKIIKKISLEKLVIFVTHNTTLANNYADRIINVEDGKISSDEINDFKLASDLDYDDNTLYLGDLHKVDYEGSLKTYYKNKDDLLNLTIIKVNNQLYLKTNDPNIKINIIDNKSNVKLVQGKKEQLEVDEFETDFSLEELEKNVKPKVSKSNFTFKESLIEALKKIVNVGRKTKIQIFSLILLGIMFSLSIHSLFSNLIFNNSTVNTDKNVYYTRKINNQVDDLDETKYLRYWGELYAEYSFVTGRERNHLLMEGYLPIEAIKEKDLIYGVMPKNETEIVIDSSVLDEHYNSSIYYLMNGITEARHLIGEEIYFRPYIGQRNETILKIVGVVKTNTKKWYANKELIENLVLKTSLYYTFNNEYKEYVASYSSLDDYDLESGRKPLNNDFFEVVIPKSLNDELIETERVKIENTLGISIVGVYNDDNQTEKYFFTTNEAIKNIFKRESLRGYTYVYSIDGSLPNDDFINLRAEQVEEAKNQTQRTRASSVSQMVFSVVISSLIFYFLVRSSLTKRVRELSIYRALGIHKYEIKTTFAIEYLLTSLMTSFVGVLIGTIIIKSISDSILGSVFISRVTLLSFLVSAIGILVTNVLIALIPVTMLLRKKPASLLTHFDI